MNHKQELSDQEIQSYMDFNRVLENRKMALHTTRRTTILKWGIPLSVVILATIGFLVIEDNPSTPTENLQPPQSLRSIDPVIIPSDSLEPVKKGITNSTEPAKEKKDAPATVKPEEEIPEKTVQPIVPEEGYVQAEPLNGYPDLYAYFSANLIYPASALSDSIQGVQTISFIITKDGSVEQIEVEESLGEEFEKESIRLIQNMPEWQPARLDGKPVATRISLPITFQIQKINK